MGDDSNNDKRRRILAGAFLLIVLLAISPVFIFNSGGDTGAILAEVEHENGVINQPPSDFEITIEQDGSTVRGPTAVNGSYEKLFDGLDNGQYTVVANFNDGAQTTSKTTTVADNTSTVTFKFPFSGNDPSKLPELKKTETFK